jgi:hypothetical protein
LTLRFFQNSQEDSCNYGNSSSALTFTTSSIPITSHCFDFEDLFSGNATQGFVNQTQYLGGAWGTAGIDWQLGNVESFDLQGNYSSVLYRQHVTNPSSENYKPGNFADRRVTIYGGKGCTEKDPSNDKGLLPWYGFSCWSEDKGSCGNLRYKIASFNINSKPKEDQGTCWVFAETGASARVHSSSKAIAGAFISASLALWITL